MKNKLLLTLALLVFCLPAFSQTADSVSYKNHLGIIGGHGAPIGIIYKRQVKPNAAWRLIQSGNYGKQSQPVAIIDNSAGSFKHKQNQFYLQTLIGYEWQNQLTNRWALYYGADAGVGFGKNFSGYDFDNYKPDQFSQRTFYKYTSTFQSYIVRPIAGVKFAIKPRIYVAMETNLTLIYERTKNKTFETTFTETQVEPVTQETGKNTGQSFRMGFSPISNIQLVYKF